MHDYRDIISIGLQEKYSNVALVFLGAAFLIWVITIWMQPVTHFAPTGEGSSNASGGYVERTLPQKASYNIIVSKDIFNSSRAPYSSKAVSASRAATQQRRPAQAPNLTLLGTVLLDDGEAAIIRKSGAEKVAKHYKVGNMIDGYVIVDISKKSVLLQKGGQTMEISMVQAAGTGAVKQPAGVKRPGQGRFQGWPR